MLKYYGVVIVVAVISSVVTVLVSKSLGVSDPGVVGGTVGGVVAGLAAMNLAGKQKE
ncbi:MAG: hypothetical protein AAEJ04_01100 [Planctomycetota bacterium]